jgi:hypothetical protein
VENCLTLLLAFGLTRQCENRTWPYQWFGLRTVRFAQCECHGSGWLHAPAATPNLRQRTASRDAAQVVTQTYNATMFTRVQKPGMFIIELTLCFTSATVFHVYVRPSDPSR